MIRIIINLTEEELQTIFNSIDTSTSKGLKNLVILVLLYDTAARSNEIINLKVADIHLEEKYIILNGKGSKKRVVPIMENTKDLLYHYIIKNKPQESLFEIKSYELIRYLFKKVNREHNFNKIVTPHTFRRTRAVHLLDKGVNVMYIQELLGHESVSTTQEYAKVIEKAKFDAIKKATPNIKSEYLEDWNNNRDLLNQLLKL